jgi:exodeoxyribonuclease VII small subunit
MSPPTPPADDAVSADPPSLTYEEARDQLVDVVKQLESGGLTLGEAIALWERGEKLADVCQVWLDGAKARLEAAAPNEPGERNGE